MAITYVNDLRLSEMATGDNSGTWGTVTNTNLELIGEALGYGTEAITTNADAHTSTIADGSTDPVRALYVEYTGTLDSACTITIAPNTVNKVCFIENGTSGSQNIIISQGSGANVTIPPGDTKAVYLNGAGSGAAVVDAFASLSVVDLNVSGNLDVDGTANLDAVDIDGAVQIDNTLSVGVNDTGYDVKFFGATASAYMQWDASADDLILGGAAGLSVNSAALVTGVLTTTAATVFNGGFASNADSTSSGKITINKSAEAFVLRSGGATTTNYFSIGRTGEDARISMAGADNAGVTTSAAGDLVIGVNNNFVLGKGGVPFLNVSSSGVTINENSANHDFRVESNGNANMLFVDGGNDKVLIGTNTPRTTFYDDSFGAQLQIEGLATTSNYIGLSIVTNSNDANGGFLALGSTRGTAVNATTVLQAGDAIGALTFQGSDGSNMVSGADIIAEVLSGVGANDMPTKLILRTNSGTTAPVERMKIQHTSGNNVVIADGLTLTDGDLIIGGAGHGIDFSAQTTTSVTGASAGAEVSRSL